MAEYIKRYDAMKICQNYSTHCFSVSDAKGQDIADKIEDEIAEIPTADVEEVKHGEWKTVVYNDTCIATCSSCRRQSVERECNATSFKLENEFCRKCGAKMDGGKTE